MEHVTLVIHAPLFFHTFPIMLGQSAHELSPEQIPLPIARDRTPAVHPATKHKLQGGPVLTPKEDHRQ